MIRSFITGGDTYGGQNNKLGDIFDSNLAILGTPSPLFNDILDLNNIFATYSNNHQRKTSNNTRIIIGGANDGQLHAFKTKTGDEAWSFIPPNSLPNLQLIAHPDGTTLLQHTYFVDGPVTTADAWLCSTGCDYTHKVVGDWYSLIVFGLGKGNAATLWSDTAKCAGNGISHFNPTYTSTYKYYCGYYALDATTSPSTGIDSLKWTIGTDTASASAPYLGQPWSKMSIGRVKYGSKTEQWVGFMGGGYNSANCAGSGSCDTRGKGIFIIDMASGSIVNAFTTSAMKYSFPATPAKIDSDYDGFVDAVYIGDMGGNIWRLNLCKHSDSTSCSWTVAKLYDSSSDPAILPIYSKPVISKDANGNNWVYWGTGDAQNPTLSTSGGRFYGLKDGGGTYTFNDLQVTSSSSPFAGSKQGWTITLAGTGEKVLGDPGIYGGTVYFTTFTPAGTDLCTSSGTPKLYSTGFLTGVASSTALNGSGIASGAIISIGPTGTPNMYVGVSGAGSTNASIQNPVNPTATENKPTLRYWRDKRAQ